MADGDYIELEVLKKTLELANETYADDDLRIAITAASDAVNSACGRRFTLDPENQTREYVPRREGWMEIDDLVEVTEISSDLDDTGQFTIWAASDYQLEPLNAAADGAPYTELRLAVSSPVGPFEPSYGRVKVTGKFGWPAIPASITEATSILATRLVKRAREAPFGVAGMGLDGAAVRVSSTDPDVRMLLGPYGRGTRLA